MGHGAAFRYQEPFEIIEAGYTYQEIARVKSALPGATFIDTPNVLGSRPNGDVRWLFRSPAPDMATTTAPRLPACEETQRRGDRTAV